MKILSRNWLLFFLFGITGLVYQISSPGPTSYNYFDLLSRGFLQGNLYVDHNPSWLNELVPMNGHYYVVYPPMPAVVMLPAVFLFPHHDIQTEVSILLGAVNVVLVFILIEKITKNKKTAFLVAIFFGFGTNHWFLVSIGSAWYIAHIVALTFLLLAVLETVTKQRLWLIGLLIGASFWSRTTIIFTVPFFYIYLHKKLWPINKRHLINFLLLNSGIWLFIFFDSLYNFLRFNNWSPLSPYQLIPNLNQDVQFNQGFMSPRFITRHLEALFLKLPKVQETFPYLIPSQYSLAIWFTSPALIFIFNFRKKLLTLACWAAILPTLFILMLWAGVGYSQFGYRFAQDFMPFLLILVALGISGSSNQKNFLLSFALGKKSQYLFYILLVLSILVNLWGVWVINKLGVYVM